MYGVRVCCFRLATMRIVPDRLLSGSLAPGHDSELDTPPPWVATGHNIMKVGAFEVQLAADSRHEAPVYIG